MLSLHDTKSGRTYSFDLSRVVPSQELPAGEQDARIEMIEAHKVWLHGQVIDAATGRPTPARLVFRSREGRYILPYGHRTEINDGWFQVELPVDEVFVEVSTGFEYEHPRKRLTIEADQRELNLEISRFTDLRAKGWVTADRQVHFLSPSTTVLEGQAEGLNLINLLAAQMGATCLPMSVISRQGPVYGTEAAAACQ